MQRRTRRPLIQKKGDGNPRNAIDLFEQLFSLFLAVTYKRICPAICMHMECMFRNNATTLLQQKRDERSVLKPGLMTTGSLQ